MKITARMRISITGLRRWCLTTTSVPGHRRGRHDNHGTALGDMIVACGSCIEGSCGALGVKIV